MQEQNIHQENLLPSQQNQPGSYLTTPGIASDWTWRPHQTRVVARIVSDGNTYMAHAVGSGKTSAMIGAGMEMRRLGLVKKPMYAVPNHMLGQFTKEFYEQYPTGALQSEVVELTDVRVTVKAWAYRTPDDPRPGIGHSYVNIPGATKFTRGSEIENAETSAWGRALAAIGIKTGKGIASREEIANKEGEWERPDPHPDQRRPSRPPQPRIEPTAPTVASEAQFAEWFSWGKNTHGLEPDVMVGMLGIATERFNQMTHDELKRASVAIESKLGAPPEEAQKEGTSNG